MDKWRVLLLIFLTVYCVLLLQNLAAMTIQWDESGHLLGGVLILHGHFGSYMTTDAFYPPLNDLIEAVYFAVAGPSVFVGRLVAVTFVIIALVTIFEFTRKIYGARTAFLSAVLLGTMPGLIWVSRVAILDTALLFFYSATMFLFFMWLQTHKDRYLLLSGLALGVGFLAKYPIVITVIPMLVSIFLFGKDYMKQRLTKLPLLLLIACSIAVPWIITLYQTNTIYTINQWIVVMNTQIPQNLNVPTPLYYLVAMVWPYGTVHPISFIIYGFGLAGLGFMVWRHNPADKFLLIWFVTAYVFFSSIGQTQWRYIFPVFPVLAIAAANLITLIYGKAESLWKKQGSSLKRVRLGKISAVALIFVTVFAVVYSGVEAYNWIEADSVFDLPLTQTAQYMAGRLDANESMVVLCPINVFNANTMRFHLYAANNGIEVNVLQYPNLAVDVNKPNFDTTELINNCKSENVKYLVLFEYGEIFPYHDSTLTAQQVCNMLNETKSFTLQTSFGSYPQKIFVYSFVNDSI